jgi:predicted DNA-binding transcriptional regulator AlpA
VHSALADVRRAVPTAKLIEAAPDLVGLTDVAEIVGVSRQNMRKLMLAYPDSFPLPVHEGSTSIWHLADVLAWLQAKGGYPQVEQVMDVARVALQVNAAKEGQRVSRSASKELEALVG